MATMATVAMMGLSLGDGDKVVTAADDGGFDDGGGGDDVLVLG